MRALATPTVLAMSLLAAGCSIEAGEAGLDLILGSQSREAAPFEWRGEVADGDLIEIKGVNGQIRAEASAGNAVEVRATREGRRSDPNDVRIEVVEHDRGVTICAVYPGNSNECRPGDRGRIGARNNDVKVAFEVAVPAGVRFVGRTSNGSVSAEDLSGDVEVRTTNGNVDISTRGNAEARTVNGSIRASLGRADWTGGVAFETVNGSITLELPEDTHAEVRARTVNGSIKSDLPVAVTEVSRRRLDGVIGDGGRRLDLETVNGSIRINVGS